MGGPLQDIPDASWPPKKKFSTLGTPTGFFFLARISLSGVVDETEIFLILAASWKNGLCTIGGFLFF